MEARCFGPFWPEQAEKDEWIAINLDRLQKPESLHQRNLMQMYLTDQYVARFGVTHIEALQHIAPVFGEKFPH
jgi:hypothetical protein